MTRERGSLAAPAFLLCRRCGVLHALFDHAQDESGPDDLAAFRAEHEAHGLDYARRVPDSALFEGPLADPMSTRWIRVVAGTDELVVRSSRRTIDEPRRHELRTAAPAITASVDVDVAMLRTALERHFSPHVLRPATEDAFVHAVGTLLADLDPATVETTFDDPTLPNGSIGPLPDDVADALLARSAALFDAWELERIHAFVAAHRREDGALAVRVIRTISRSAA
jgi:hypothetical protein